jgi:hypothetical protein
MGIGTYLLGSFSLSLSPPPMVQQGGSRIDSNHAPLSQLYSEDVQRLVEKETNILAIGEMAQGGLRHRALLFKVRGTSRPRQQTSVPHVSPAPVPRRLIGSGV